MTIATNYTIFQIWDMIEMFWQVACFILIHLTALKYIRIMPWFNNENKFQVIDAFHVHLNDVEMNIFGAIIPSCIFI